MTDQSFHDAVVEFKRRLISETLERVHGNRTHAAIALGMRRTYLLRLLRQLAIDAPPSAYRPAARRRATEAPGPGQPQRS